jgi:Tfp pilus assembly protein PilF
VRMLRLVAVLAVGAVGAAPAQLAVNQPTEKLLLLPLVWSTAADSAAAIGISDAARERLGQLARYKVLLVPKAKICEALKASGFPCDGLMEPRQADQLARFLSVPSYTQGTLGHSTASYAARIHVVSGGSGFSSTFSVTGGANGTPNAISEAIAQRLFTIIKAAENARNCNEQRSRNNVQKALEEARKALVIEPNLTAAHLCLINVYEIQHLGPDSTIAQAMAALKGDSLSSEAWNRLANARLAKADTTGWLDALAGLARTDIHNTNTLIGVATLMVQNKRAQKAVDLVDEGLAANPGSAALLDFKQRTCIEAGLYRCVLTVLSDKVKNDTTLLSDSILLRIAIGAGQQLSDTQASLFWTHAAVRHSPRSTSFQKTLAEAFMLAGMTDSALTTYRNALQLDPNDINLSLLIAKTMVDRAVFDTAAFKRCQVAKDSTCIKGMPAAFAARVDSARPYLRPGVAASDSGQRLTAAVIMLSAGSKLAQASAHERAYPWLDTLLTLVAPRAPGDTLGARQQIRVQASFWYGLSSVLSLGPVYQDMIKSKNCGKVKDVSDRIQRSKQALFLGGRIAPQVATQMLGYLSQYEANIPKAKQAFHCTF